MGTEKTIKKNQRSNSVEIETKKEAKSKNVVNVQINRYQTNDDEQGEKKIIYDKNDKNEESVQSKTKTPRSPISFNPFSPNNKTKTMSLSPFAAAVEHHLLLNHNDDTRDEEEFDLYKNIVSHQFRPFDVYA